MAGELTAAARQRIVKRLQLLPVPARRLLCVVVRQVFHGTLCSKAPGRATMPEIHEACGLDVGDLQELLTLLKDAHFVTLEGSYPFEELQLEGDPVGDTSVWEIVLHRCAVTGTSLESVIVDMQLDGLFDTF
jgi:hypothetical protein